jgi:hypothetical protein
MKVQGCAPASGSTGVAGKLCSVAWQAPPLEPPDPEASGRC